MFANFEIKKRLRKRYNKRGFTQHYLYRSTLSFVKRLIPYNTYWNIKRHSNKSGAGFTIIELLVVISIIALLSSIVFSALNSARSKARDARRVSDMRILNTAIELGRSDDTFMATGVPSGMSALDYLVTNGYISEVPLETYHTTNSYQYHVCTRTSGLTGYCWPDSDNMTYSIRFRMEKASNFGGAGYYCLTSEGIFPRETSGLGGGSRCLQR